MGDFNDAGLQRAIMNSLRTAPPRQSNGGGQQRLGTNRPAPAAPPRRDDRMVPYHSGGAPRYVPPPPPRPSRDIAPTIPGLREPARVAGPTVGKKSTLQKEGILPTQPTPAHLLPTRVVSAPRGEGQESPKEKETPTKAKKTTTAVRTSSNPRGGTAAPPVKDDDGLDPKLVSVIESEIVDRSPGVQWDDIAGAPEAKRLLNEAIVLPLLVPEFFLGIRTPWRGVLLFGPPGTGKTMLARAVATCTKTTFFNIGPSTLVSRYHGESEKLVKTLFRVARKRAPSTVFLDEVDALVGRRGEGQEHEASRRLKSEILSQLDGIEATGGVIVLATTNRPWDLDEAMRRRLEKRIYLPLPDAEARRQLLALHLRGVTLGGGVAPDLDDLAARTDGYSGADINQVCREAAMAPMRRAVDGLGPIQISAMKDRGELNLATLAVSHGDLVGAIANVPSSVSPAELSRYAKWMEEFGSR